MNYLNIDVRVIETPDFMAASHHEIGIWFRLMNYCAKQENGGVIRGCKEWSDRMWIASVNVSLEDVQQRSKLWQFSAGLLVVTGYPRVQEEVMRAKREGGKRSAEARKQPSSTLLPDKTLTNTLAKSLANTVGGNGKERKGNRNGKEIEKEARKVNGKPCDHVTIFGQVDPRGCSDSEPKS